VAVRPLSLARRSLTFDLVDVCKVASGAISRLLPQFSLDRVRTLALRAAGVHIGRASLVMGAFEVTGPGRMRELLWIGDETLITGPLRVDLGAEVRIGHRVRMGHDVMLLTVNHEVGPPHYRCGRMVAAPITVGDGAWLASRVTVLPGVTIGRGSVVGAGAVVTRDIAPHVFAAGVPAREIHGLPDH
jgi:UDP-3-O-[3-hydroxymyristoyl] glucosamine N-acyltransferase